MTANLLLLIVMMIVGVVFLLLPFLFPGEITIGAFIASFLMAVFFYALHKKKRNYT